MDIKKIIKKGFEPIDEATMKISGLTIDQSDSNRAAWNRQVTIRASPVISTPTSQVSGCELTVNVLMGSTQSQ